MTDCLLPTYDCLSEEQIKKINDNSFIFKYKKGDIICRTNLPVTHVLYLKSGLVKLYREDNIGRTTIVGIVTKDKFFGLMSAYSKKVFQVSFSALSDTEIVHTPYETFVDILNNNGRYAFVLLNQISGFSLMLLNKMIMNATLHIPGRIATLLLFFAKEIYGNNSFELPVSRQEIAEFISSTKETVSRTLTEFKHDGLIELDDKNITLKSPELILKLSKMG